jgi:hypothetical protein
MPFLARQAHPAYRSCISTATMLAKKTAPAANRTEVTREINSRFCSCASDSTWASAAKVASAVGISIDKESPFQQSPFAGPDIPPVVHQNTRITWDCGDNNAQSGRMDAGENDNHGPGSSAVVLPVRR